MLVILLIAQVLWGTAFTNPRTLQTDIYVMPPDDPLLDYESRIIERDRLKHSASTGQVYDPFSGQTMIRTVAPPSPYYNMTREQATKLREIETEQLKGEALLREAEFKQKNDAMEYKYKLSQIDQSEKFLQGMQGLDPRNPDYITERSRLNSTYPLAAQNPVILRNLELLDKTHNDLQQNDQIINRQKKIQGDAEKERDINQGRTMALKIGGSRGLAMYENLLKSDPNNPIGVMAEMVDAQEQQSAITELKRLNLDDNRINQFYSQEMGPDGRPTGRRIFDHARAKDFIASTPDISNVNSTIARRDKIRENNLGAYDTWPDDVKAEWDITVDILKRYRQSAGQPEVTLPPKVKSAASWFGK